MQKVKSQSRLIKEITDFYEVFLETEQELFRRKTAGIRYWHYIRFDFFNELLNGKKWIEKIDHHEHRTLLMKVGIATNLLKNSLLHGVRKDKSKDDVLVLSSAKKKQKGSSYIDPYTYYWLRKMRHPYTAWEDHLLWSHRKHGQQPGLFFLDDLYVRAIFYRFLMFRKICLASEDEIDFLRQFAMKFDLEIPKRKLISLLTNVVALHKSNFGYIKNKLSEKDIRLVVLINHYEPLKMLIVSIARSLGIYTVELQHGNMGRYHIAYNFGNTNTLTTLPDEILTFGEFWNETTTISQNNVKMTSTGMPFFEENLSQVELSPCMSDNKKVKILILSQEVIGPQLALMAIELFQRLDPDGYEIWYKLHPREYGGSWKVNYPSEFENLNIRVLADCDLYALFAQSDIHIGVYSTTIMEGLAFNKKLILVELYGVHYFSDLINSGRAFFARNSDEIQMAIENDSTQFLTGRGLSYYWEQKSVEKINQRISEILK